MQKLIKRKLHYETIMPVEAYHPEDDTWQDEIADSITLAGCGAAIVTGSIPGIMLCGAALMNEMIHTEEYQEGLQAQAEADLLMADAIANTPGAIANTVSDAYNAGAEAITDAYIDWYYDDELAEEIKNRKGGG